MLGFFFNGVSKYYVRAVKKKRPAWATLQRNILTVPGRPGGYLQDTDTKPRVIPVTLFLINEDFYDLQKLKEDLAAWLVTNEEKELIFEDEPDRAYYAVIDGSFDPDEFVDTGIGSVNFICPDPYKYGPEKKLEFVNTLTFNVEGSKETPPTIRVQLKQDSTYLAISDGEQINLIGNPIEPEQIPFEPETRKMWHECNSLVGWSGTTSVEGGTNKGTLKTNGYSFFTDDYGVDTGWHGPAMKRSIGASLQDFKIDILLSQKGTSGQIGSVEIALLDVNNQIVAKMLMSKRTGGSPANYARIRAGNDANGHDLMNERGATEWTWADFEGMLRIVRRGTSWAAYVAKVGANGAHHSSLYKSWEDTNGLYNAKITQVQVQVWQYGSISPTTQLIHDIKVFELNQSVNNGVPNIVRTNQIVEFNHKTDKILRDGESVTKEKAFIGEYFSLKPGTNTIIVEPAEAIEKAEVIWKNRWF